MKSSTTTTPAYDSKSDSKDILELQYKNKIQSLQKDKDEFIKKFKPELDNLKTIKKKSRKIFKLTVENINISFSSITDKDWEEKILSYKTILTNIKKNTGLEANQPYLGEFMNQIEEDLKNTQDAALKRRLEDISSYDSTLNATNALLLSTTENIQRVEYSFNFSLYIFDRKINEVEALLQQLNRERSSTPSTETRKRDNTGSFKK